MDGFFHMSGKEEKKIRTDPEASNRFIEERVLEIAAYIPLKRTGWITYN